MQTMKEENEYLNSNRQLAQLNAEDNKNKYQ